MTKIPEGMLPMPSADTHNDTPRRGRKPRVVVAPSVRNAVVESY